MAGFQRAQALPRALVAHSDGQVGGERLAQALSAFDQVQGLDMEEIWLAPLALRLALLEAFYTVGLQVARGEHLQLDALLNGHALESLHGVVEEGGQINALNIHALLVVVQPGQG